MFSYSAQEVTAESLLLFPESEAPAFIPLLGPRLIFLRHLKALKTDAGVDESPAPPLTLAAIGVSSTRGVTRSVF